MAYLSATDLNDLQELGGKDESRYSQVGLVDAAKDSTEFLDFIAPGQIEAMQKLSSVRNFQNVVITDETPTVVTTPGFNFIPTNLPTSAQYTFTAVDIFSGFRFYPASYEDNAIDMEWEKRNRMKKILYQMAITKEGLIQTVMESRKTQIFAGSAQVTAASAGTINFNTGTDTLDINLAAQTDTMFNNIQAMFEINELPGMLRYITNRGGLQPQFVNALKYGAGNDRNLQALGLPDPGRYYQTGTVAAGSDVFNGYVFRDGAIGLIENFPFDFRNGTNFAGKEWSVSDMEMPWTRSRINVYVDNQAAEATSLINSSNMKMTHFQEMALWDRFFIVFPYNSDLTTRANDIVKISGATS